MIRARMSPKWVCDQSVMAACHDKQGKIMTSDVIKLRDVRALPMITYRTSLTGSIESMGHPKRDRMRFASVGQGTQEKEQGAKDT